MIHSSGPRNSGKAFLVILAALGLAAAGRAQESTRIDDPDATPAKRLSPVERHTLLEAWKAGRRAERDASEAAQSDLQPFAIDATAEIGRASLAINGAGSIAFTRNYLGAANNCDVDFGSALNWQRVTAYEAGDHAQGAHNNFIATNSGTSGSSEPTWHTSFGATTSDGTITWKCVGTIWVSGRAYAPGMTVLNATGGRDPGFTYQAESGGTSGLAEPQWPTTAGATVNDNGIVWKAIGYFPGSFRNCNPLQMVLRSPGGTETVIASEGDAVGSVQLSGWGEFIALNASGRVAFKAAAVDLLADQDESGTGIFLAGPGAGSLTKIATAGDVIGGRYTCGFSTMVGENDAGQVVFDGYSVPSGSFWQSLHSYTRNDIVIPTRPNGLRYVARNSGTTASAEPAFPTSLNATVADGSVVWVAETNDYPLACSEDNHGLIRYSAAAGNELLVANGSSVGGSTVVGFGADVNDSSGTNRCSACAYNDIDGLINPAGHVPIVLKLADGSQGVYNFTGPATSTEVARTGGSSQLRSISPRVSINNSDQIAFKALLGPSEHLFRFTPPSTTVSIVAADDDVGTRTVGKASGVTFASFGNFFDLNNSGNLVFQAKLSGKQEGYYFWDGSSGLISEIHRQSDVNGLASEMITVNDRNLVAYVTGSTAEGGTDDHSEGHETGGAFFWQAGGTQKAIAVGDQVGGDRVSTVYAQHQSFIRRQMNESGCLAVVYHVLNDDPEFDCAEGSPTGGFGSCTENSMIKGGQLFVSCAPSAHVIPVSAGASPAQVSGR